MRMRMMTGLSAMLSLCRYGRVTLDEHQAVQLELRTTKERLEDVMPRIKEVRVSTCTRDMRVHKGCAHQACMEGMSEHGHAQ